MRLLTGKRIGQSRQELALSVLFSFILHILLFVASMLLYLRASPKIYVPPFYEVTLVEPSAELPEIMPPAPLPDAAEKPPQATVAPEQDAMPELRDEKKPKKAREEKKEAEPLAEPPAAQAVAVTSPEDFKFPPYLAIIRDKIVRNWNPPPGAREIKARIVFKIYRSGVVGDADLAEASGNFYFDQAAMRAILASSPFPPLPEGFYKEYEVFSVDLMEKE